MKFIVFLLILLFCTTTFAQSPAEIEKEMRAIEEQMGRLERLLAEASIISEDAERLMKALSRLAAGEEETVPKIVKDFLRNNPDILEKLGNKTKKEVDDLLNTEGELNNFLKNNTKLFKQILSNRELVIDALKRHAKIENDLQRLFSQTKNEMKKTEDALKKLVDMASQAQLQTNRSNQRNDENSSKLDPKSLDREDGKSGEREAKPVIPEDFSRFRSPNEADPRVWRDPTAVRPGESTLGALSGTSPRGYEQELAEYMKALAKAGKQR